MSSLSCITVLKVASQNLGHVEIVLTAYSHVATRICLEMSYISNDALLRPSVSMQHLRTAQFEAQTWWFQGSMQYKTIVSEKYHDPGA